MSKECLIELIDLMLGLTDKEKDDLYDMEFC